MSAPLLNTKFYSPTLRSNLISRPRLEKKLSQSLARRLTLVSAPPGFGKTTLVAAWANSLKRGCDHPAQRHTSEFSTVPIAGWLHLDEGDNDTVCFFAYLVAALQKLEPDLGQDIQSQLGEPQLPPLEALITMVANDLSVMDEDIVLILDDYHLIRSEMIHKAITCLIEQQPPNMHLILITREDPPLPLSRLRARDEMIEVRERDLRFSIQEATDFLKNTMGLNLTSESIATLTNRTEGWVAGLQMAGLSLQDRSDTEDFIASFCGHDRYIIDYLMEELIRHQPEEVQNFLLRTSILDRLSASLCDEVVRDEICFASAAPFHSSQEILDYLERSNLFIVPLDNNRQWYRYHHLFADLLRYRLVRQFPERLPQLHQRAYDWFKLAGDIEEAMKHALAMPDLTLAADLAEGYLHKLIRASRIATCLDWIQHLSIEMIRSRAYLVASCAWVHVLNGDIETANRYLEECRMAMETYEPVYSPTEQRWITPDEVAGHLFAIQAYGARLQGDFPKTIELSQKSLERLPIVAHAIRCVVALNLGIVYMVIWDPEMAWKTLLEAYEMAKVSENLFVAVTALCQLAGIAIGQGRLRQAERLCQQAIQTGTLQAAKAIELPAVTYAHGWLAAVHDQRDEAAAAQSHLAKALEMVELVGPLNTIIYSRIYQSRLSLDAGDHSQAEASLRWAEEKIKQYPVNGPIRTEWIVSRGRLLLENGEIAEAIRWLASQNVSAMDLPGTIKSSDDLRPMMWFLLPEYLLLSRVLLAKREYPGARSLLERICLAAGAWQCGEVGLETLVFLAIAAALYRRPGERPSQALDYLEQALQIAEPEGYIRPFLVAGEPMMSLLRQAIAQDIHPAYASKLLAHLSEHLRLIGSQELGRGQSKSVALPAVGLVEPVTERERQILRLLAAGLSSTEIAETLILSVHTTRSYMKSLYRKLDAHSRDEAIEKGTQFGLF